jgi:hypothetical protein
MFFIFCYDSDFAKQLRESMLIQESPHPMIAVPNVDSAVNNCALICALLLNVPIGIISNLTTSDNLFQMMVNPFGFNPDRPQCILSLDFSNLRNTAYNSHHCFSEFKENFSFVYISTIVCFYSALYTLLTAVFYYMCRPAESSHNSSKIILFEAYTLEIRDRMRKEMHSQGAEAKKIPSESFNDPALESQVLMRAKFYAENEAEEQKNLEFYIWYKSTFVAAVFALMIWLMCGVATLIATFHTDTGGRFLVVGIFVGLILAGITAIGALHFYMESNLNATTLSYPFFTPELVNWIAKTVLNYSFVSWNVGLYIVLLFVFICL